MDITIPDGVSEEEMISAVSNSIAETLGVHPGDVDVSIDMETGEVSFIVSSDSFDEAAGNQFDLTNEQNKDAIANAIEAAVPSATVDTFAVSDDVTATLEFTVDADEATNNLTQAAWQSEELLSDFGSVVVESSLYDF